MNNILLISTTLLAFSGFAIAFYGTMSRSMIEKETKKGMNKGIDSFTDEGSEYFARKYEKWKAGNFFNSDIAVIVGLLTVLASTIINYLKNPWWSSIITLIVGYIIYLIISKTVGWKVQFISLIILLLSLSYSIYLML